MTQDEFDALRFCAGMIAEYRGSWYKVISCNFPERLFALCDDSGIDADDPTLRNSEKRSHVDGMNAKPKNKAI